MAKQKERKAGPHPPEKSSTYSGTLANMHGLALPWKTTWVNITNCEYSSYKPSCHWRQCKSVWTDPPPQIKICEEIDDWKTGRDSVQELSQCLINDLTLHHDTANFHKQYHWMVHCKNVLISLKLI
jgi:hypothetical protein